MSRRLSEILFLFILGVTMALAPMACESDDNGGTGDGSTDSITSMTPG